MDGELIYSYSNGAYWSKYNHCRVWTDDTYDLVVKDKYGQTTTTQIEITNNQKAILGIPVIYTNGYTEGTWSPTDVSVNVSPGLNGTKVVYHLSTWSNPDQWNTVSGNVTFTSGTGDTYAIFKTQDVYGNESLPLTFVPLIDKTAPTNINFVPRVSISNEIYTTVTAVNAESPMRYSISYDGGTTWSSPQISNNFGYMNPPKGNYTVNCRAYNSSGLYVQGSPIAVQIT